ncbi:MAG: hypothetical protein WBD20_10205 [Pirellulaceae bacterium]
MRNNNCQSVTFGVVILMLVAGCAHQPTLDRARRPFIAKGNGRPAPAFALIKPSDKAFPAAQPSVNANQSRKQVLSEMKPTTAAPIQQASAMDVERSIVKATTDGQAESNPFPMPLITVVSSATQSDDDFLQPTLSFGFNDLDRQDELPVQIEIPPSMKHAGAANNWKLGSSELAETSIEELN